MNIKRLVCIFMLLFSVNTVASEAILLGKTKEVLFDKIKQEHIVATLKRLLASCQTHVRIEAKSIPKVEYKGVRVNLADGKVIEAHIFPDSLKSYHVKLYTNESGTIYQHGKYTDYAYQLIAMLEVKQ